MRIRYSEMFYSLQGEGRFVGVPSVFLRTFGCNFQCHGFGQPADRSLWLPQAQMPHMTQDLTGITSLDELPVVEVGCDSSASWSARYRHLSRHESTEEIAQKLTGLTPQNRWTAAAGEPIHLVITGGEPLLAGWQRAYPALLAEPQMDSLRELTFETNGTQPLQPALSDALRAQQLSVTWSVSPKLRRSGEAAEKALRPEVLAAYAATPGSTLCLKFVVHDAADVAEAAAAAAMYRDAGVAVGAVYAMPAGGGEEMYTRRRATIAALCLEHGLRYSPRLHIDLFGNRFGT
ncbi:MAG: 7-carboxy-7-deazaguanine synthase [Myxococcota bacterium]